MPALRRATPWDQHRDLLAVLMVDRAEFGQEILLFQLCSNIDPARPEHIEEQPVNGQVDARPEKNDRGSIPGVAHPSVWAPVQFVGSAKSMCSALEVRWNPSSRPRWNPLSGRPAILQSPCAAGRTGLPPTH